MMKIIAVLGIVMVILCSTAASQNESGFGIGIIAGEPTGIAGKTWISQTTAFAGAAAWSFREEAAFHMHVDYVLHSFDLIKIDKGKLPIYYGIGGRVKLADDSKVGVRIPVGLDYLFEGAPVDVFVEIVPILELVPETEFSLNGGIGVRYFF